MKAAPFAYHRPDTVADAVSLLGDLGEDAKILAGGQSLVPMLAMRLTHFENLIDISRVERAAQHRAPRRRPSVWIGAGTPHAFVGMDDEVAESVPLLTLSTPHIGHFQIRTRGTLGGAIAHADPAAEYAAVALALDAEIEATSARGSRRIPAAEFFTGLWETALAADEILTAVAFPVWSGRCGFAVHEFARGTATSRSRARPSPSSSTTTTAVTRCGIGLLGLGSTPERGTPAEEAVVGRPVTDITADEFGRLAISALRDVPTDLQGTAAYRTKVGATMVARAWTQATTEALNA